jgi:hypothetical protein
MTQGQQVRAPKAMLYFARLSVPRMSASPPPLRTPVLIIFGFRVYLAWRMCVYRVRLGRIPRANARHRGGEAAPENRAMKRYE